MPSKRPCAFSRGLDCKDLKKRNNSKIVLKAITECVLVDNLEV